MFQLNNTRFTYKSESFISECKETTISSEQGGIQQSKHVPEAETKLQSLSINSELEKLNKQLLHQMETSSNLTSFTRNETMYTT